jgi:thiamine-monophosphate kinase
MENDSQKLDDIGERKIIENILKPRYHSAGIPRFGDDCAFVGMSSDIVGGTIVATTDPCPYPMSRSLGFSDYYYDGWLLATINLSDLAAAGAQPLGLLTSLTLTNDMTITDLERLLDGIDDCCNACSTHVIGGNLKEGSTTNLQATAIGVCNQQTCVSRVGCHENDLIVIIGDLGMFWAGVLAVKNKIPLRQVKKKILLRNILTPTPKVKVAMELAQHGILTACIDNSDGLYPSLLQLSEANNLQMYLSFNNIIFNEEVYEVSRLCDVDPLKLSLGWGDWQLVGCVNPSNLQVLKEIVNRHSINSYILGTVRNGRGVILESEGKTCEMIHLDSQRFTKDSWFTAGLDTYITSLVNGPLWEE